MPRKVLPDGVKGMPVIGPYSPVVQIGQRFHFSGIIPAIAQDEAGSKWLPTAHTRAEAYDQVLDAMQRRLALCGLTPADVYSVQVMLRGSMDGYSEFNDRYATLFEGVPVLPRRAVFAVSDLPAGVEIEIIFDAVKQED